MATRMSCDSSGYSRAALPRVESAGELAAEGLMPRRFERMPMTRSAEITHFDIARHRIDFDGKAASIEQPPSLQDRLSWWLQIAAIAAAREVHAGMRIEIDMLGLHHEVLRWEFEVIGPEKLDGIGLSWHRRRADRRDRTRWMRGSRRAITSRPCGW